jgi:hypothetical protein
MSDPNVPGAVEPALEDDPLNAIQEEAASTSVVVRPVGYRVDDPRAPTRPSLDVQFQSLEEHTGVIDHLQNPAEPVPELERTWMEEAHAEEARRHDPGRGSATPKGRRVR